MKIKVPFMVIAMLVIIGVVSVWSDDKTAPMSASGLTDEERSAHDGEILAEEVASGSVVSIEVDYSNDAIIVRLRVPSSKQYVAETAKDLEASVKAALKERKGDLTLEKDSYFIYIYGSDKRLINY